MKIRPATIAFLILLLPAAHATDPNDLYTRIGTDPTFQELLDSGVIVPGVSFASGPVLGSLIDVNNALLAQQTGVLGPIPQPIRIHTQVNSSIQRSNFPNFTRWYQEDGNVQVMRLFEGEQNVRSGVGPTGTPGRIEAFFPAFTVQSGTWSVWEGTYTIIEPLGSNIFQLFHEGGQLWPFHLRMSSSGNITFNRRREIPGLPTNITVATNMVGKSISFRIRANGFNYEVYKKIPLVDDDWELVTVGSYTAAVDNRISFRWGMYVGSQAGQSVPKDGLLFVSGATRSTSTAPGVDPPPPPPPPVTYYWDNNGSLPGFGTASGVWGETTTGNAAQGWSEDPTGETLPDEVSTNAFDPVFFGTNTTGGGLGTGTITIADTVSCANMTFGSQSGNITLAGGEIFQGGNRLITVAGTGKTHTILSELSGWGTRTIGGGSTLALYGQNTFEEPLIIGDNTNNNLRLRFNTATDFDGGPSSLGAPLTAANGIIQIGSVSFASTLEFINAGAAQSTNRRIRIGSSSNGSGGATILNNNPDPAHSLTFTSPSFNVAATGITNTNRVLSLGGSNLGGNTISGSIIDNVGGSGGRVALTKSGTGTWILGGENSYSNGTTVSAGILVLQNPMALQNSPLNTGGSVAGNATQGLRTTVPALTLGGLTGDKNLASVFTTSLGGYDDVSALTLNLVAIYADAGSLGPRSYSGVIANGAPGMTLTKSGSGTQILNAANTYTGATTISEGKLALGATGSISGSPLIAIGPGAILDTTAQSTYAMPTNQLHRFGIDPVADGSSGTLVATGLDITNATVAFDLAGALDDPVYILATYTNLTGTSFASISSQPPGYSLNYAYQGDKIALVRGAANLYWDNNGAAPGFGTAAGTWAEPTIGDDTQGWSMDATGGSLPGTGIVDGTNGTTHAVHFGTASAGLGTGTITVSGTVKSGNMTIGSQSGIITLAGGTIQFHTQTAGAVITSNNSGTNAIESTIASGSANSPLIIFGGSVRLAGNNTFNRPIRIGSSGTLRFSTVGNVGGGNSNLGAPSDAARGLIQIGIASVGGTLLFIDADSAQSTNRQVRIGDNGNGSGGSTITNNNADPAHTLTFTNSDFNLASTGTASSFNRNLGLGGSNTGDNTIQGAIIDNGASRVGLVKSGTATWLLAGANSYSNNTNVNAGTLKIGADNVLPSGAGKGNVNVNGGDNGGILDLNGFDLAINGLGGGTGTQSGRIVNNAPGTNKTLTVGNGDASATFNGIIADHTSGTGTVALTKVGGGTQTLTGANTYSGATTVQHGTLTLNGSLANATMAIHGGTVDGTGSLTCNINGTASDAIIMTAGTFAATGLTINVNPIGAGLTEAEYVLVDATAGGTITGSFAGLTGAPGYELSYGTSNLIKLVSVSATPYETWAGGALFGDDENGDGVSNGLAFLLGAADPDVSALGLLPTVTQSGGGLVLSFSMRNATARGGATLTLQHSSDLGITDPWTSVAVPDTSGGPISGVAFTVTPGDPLNTVVATIDSSQAAGGKLFARLQVKE